MFNRGAEDLSGMPEIQVLSEAANEWLFAWRMGKVGAWRGRTASNARFHLLKAYEAPYQATAVSNPRIS